MVNGHEFQIEIVNQNNWENIRFVIKFNRFLRKEANILFLFGKL